MSLSSGVALRPHPFPYRASLALASDVDGCSPDRFEEIHRFLNTREGTPSGPGLGLDVGDSFWFYCAHPSVRDVVSYFEGVSDRPSAAAVRILGWIRRGWIDCLHSYGDFEQAGGFRRGMAERALAVLKAEGLDIRVWINHGGPFHNLQNLMHPRSLGDLPRYLSPNGTDQPVLEYHADLTVGAGMRFCWSQDLLTRVVGQDRPCGRLEHHQGADEAVPALRRLAAAALDLASVPAPAPVRRALGKACAYLGVPPYESNDLIEPFHLRDGSLVYRFRRYGDYRKDAPEDLPALLAPRILDRLEETGGSLALFTHLGKPRTRRERAFLPDEAAALGVLADRHREGRIQVLRTSSLLGQAMLRRSLRWRAEPGRILLDGVDDPVFGRFLPSPKALDQVSFLCPEGTQVLLEGRPLPVRAFPSGVRIETA